MAQSNNLNLLLDKLLDRKRECIEVFSPSARKSMRWYPSELVIDEMTHLEELTIHQPKLSLGTWGHTLYKAMDTCQLTVLWHLRAKSRPLQNVPLWCTDYFDLKWLERQPVQKGFSGPLCPAHPTLKLGNKSLIGKVFSLHHEAKR